MKKVIKKSAEELFKMLDDLAYEASMPITCSQASAVSDSWNIDNNPLLAACEGNANLDWKYNSHELECKTIDNDDINFDDALCATDLAFSSSVAMSPPTSPYEKQLRDTNNIALNDKMEANACDADIQNEADLIIKDIFESLSQESDLKEKRRIEEIEQWLLMANSSQGNEFLSSQESVANEAKEVESKAANCDVEVVELQSSDVIIEPDVSQIIALPVVDEEESPVVESRLRRKRTLDYSEVHSPSSEPKTKRKSPNKSEKKKDQNKEAAKRYRDRKKKESTEFKHQCDELEGKNRESRERINDMLKARQVLLDLWISLGAEKTNPNFKIMFPTWM